MKTTKRSKILLSSIAMLLVALVALGSATYAWYVVNKTVTAQSLTVAAKAATGLVGCKTNSSTESEWGPSVTLTANAQETKLSPVSIDPTNKTYIKDAEGTGTNDGTFKSTQSVALTDTAMTWTNGLNGTDAYLLDDFYIKSQSGTVSGVKMQIQATSNTDKYLNCLVFIDDQLAGSACIDNAKTTTNIRKADGTSANSITFDGLNTDITIGNVSSAKHVQVVCYADGENTNCKNSKASIADGSFTVYFYYN